ncbi:FliM/FliN family flagellar motor switch protein [Rhodophyticola sp. CCM32]|uniref:FliM/FliN family flagellar motor switch protein n=1 Tax=Rhodophyticola sp. CCM32 TaxID=2916397 RepID=UPI00143D1A3D|nr:flagellar motor switch protein FliM [Rhodophyticola sp. CCM32]
MARRARATPCADRGAGLRRAFQRALRRAGAPFPGLEPEPGQEDMTWSMLVGDLLTGLPDGGLLVGLDGPHGARGLCLLQQSVVDALIEVQTTGRVDPVEGPARPFTKIDIALTRDFIDLLLSAFSAELDGVQGVDWPRRMSFGGPLADRRQLPLLIPDGLYHQFAVDLAFGDGAKTGRVLLAVPVEAGSGALTDKAGQAAADPAWQAGLRQALFAAEVVFDVTLIRQMRSLAELEQLAPGDLIPFDAADLANVMLEDARGRNVLRGRLGQQGGKRAVCLTTGPVAQTPKPPSAPMPDTAPMDAAPPESAPIGSDATAAAPTGSEQMAGVPPTPVSAC